MYKVLKPSYYDKFKCVGSSCEDTCCKGWDIHVDKEIFKVYKSTKNVPITNLLENEVSINTEANYDFEYGIINLKNDGYCPFFNEKNLCDIQTYLGHENLSYTCREYPRTFCLVDKVLEMSLNTSCIEASKLILLNEQKMTFELTETDLCGEILFEKIINTNESNINYKFLNEIRDFSIEIIQNRNFSIEERLLALGLFYENILKTNNVFESINYFKNNLTKIINDEKQECTNDYQNDAKIIFFDKIFSYMVEDREITNSRFLENLRKLIKSLNLNSSNIEERKYALNKINYYNDFIKNYEHVYENYIVNYIFSKNIIATDKSLYRVYIDFMTNFLSLKLVVLGVCLFEKENMNEEKLINVIQSFSVTINHTTSKVLIDDYLNINCEKSIFNLIISVLL